MKYFILILLFGLLTGCSHESQKVKGENQRSNYVNYGKELSENGFLNFADTLKVDSLKLGLVRSFNIYDERNNKITHVDAEELAEFSFDFFLPSLNRILKKRGFSLNVQPASDIETSNDIFINEQKVKLYSKEEMENGSFWELASGNFFKEVNRQLKKKRIEESFYLLYSGNDLHVILLTDDQYKIIADKYKSDPKEIPYLP